MDRPVVFQRIFVFVLLFFLVGGQGVGEERCIKSGATGTCVNIRDCPSAIQDIKNRKQPQMCGFSGFDSIVCCVGDSPGLTPTQPPATQAATTKRVGTSTTVPDHVNITGGSSDGCQPITPALTARRNGRKAWDKCIEYQEKLVYPCERRVALTGEMIRSNYCMRDAVELVVRGSDASEGEFPHMALLGFGSDLKYVQWLCGGAIISENYILTAGHCLYYRNGGPVTYAMVGVLERSDELDPTKVYKIKNAVKHPDYKAPGKYNDIALLEMEKPITLGPYVMPACLHVGDAVADDTAIATGWGNTQYKGETAAVVLQKVILTRFSREECSAKHPPSRNMRQGFDADTQMCYGDKNIAKGTCQGDSGGPLQIENTKLNCMYTVIGVTSFGTGCGFIGEPTIFTRVEKFTPWIESVVWPDL